MKPMREFDIYMRVRDYVAEKVGFTDNWQCRLAISGTIDYLLRSGVQMSVERSPEPDITPIEEDQPYADETFEYSGIADYVLRMLRESEHIDVPREHVETILDLGLEYLRIKGILEPAEDEGDT